MNNKKTKFNPAQSLFPNSIMGRLLVASALLLPLFCGLLGLSLDRAFTASLHSGERTQLTLQAYALIAAAELDQQNLEEPQLWLPDQFTEDRLNQPSSDLFAMIFSTHLEQPLWQSPSAINNPLPNNWKPQTLKSGKSNFGEVSTHPEALFYLQYNVYWEDNSGTEHPFQFVVFETQHAISQQISTYRKNLWGWLSAIALSITVIQILILKWGLKPVREVSNDLKQIQQGKRSQLEGLYPHELREMTHSINTLLSNEAQQRKRYQNTLSDLAHSLKTPLAIMQGSLQSSETLAHDDLQEQIHRIDQIISYQLKRSVSAPVNPFSNAIPIKGNCEKIIAALNKVYREKPMAVTIDIPENLSFKGDKGDLLEILGNLLDNAFKYGNNEIKISGKRLNSKQLSISIEDNGLGILKEQRAQLLQRGERADTSMPGQGIGLSVVTDIVSSYRGSISFTQSPLGGLAVTLNL